jgi:hypothetical protein
MAGNDYGPADAAEDTGTSESKAEAAWEQAAADDRGDTSGQTVEDVAPSDSGEVTSLEDMQEAEAANED